ncbi:putative membrane protein [Lysinibacillus sp. RC79]
MRFLFNKITLFSMIFLSFCLIVIGYILQTILIPLQDINSISSKELLEFQKEYAINYPLGKGLLYLGLFLIILVIILFVIKLKNSKSDSQNSDA